MNNKKQPEAIAKLKGIYRPCRFGGVKNTEGMQFIKDMPSPPDNLDENGKGLWIYIFESLMYINGYIAKQDIPTLELLCYQYQILKVAQIDLKERGLIIKKRDKDGSIIEIQNPSWKTYNEAIKVYLQITREFGLTPSSRSGIKIAEYGKIGEDLDSFKI